MSQDFVRCPLMGKIVPSSQQRTMGVDIKKSLGETLLIFAFQEMALSIIKHSHWAPIFLISLNQFVSREEISVGGKS